MSDKFVPTWYSESIYKIDYKKLKMQNIKYILSDLDNTIVGFNVPLPTEDASKLVEKIRDNGMELIIVSNNNHKRIAKFCNPCSINFLSSACKPTSKKLLKYLINNKIDINECVFVGDQLLTDIWCAKKAKCKSILVEPLQKKESIQTFLNRRIDKIIRRRYHSEGKLVSIMKEE